jgi:hypothetical protein
MKILIAILSCVRDTGNGFNQAVRETWLKDLNGADYCFFLGRGAKIRPDDYPDEFILDCPDDYLGLPYKTKALLKAASDYEYIFKVDTDTYVVPDRLLQSDFYNYDYVGHFNGAIGVPNVIYGKCYSWASGGSGYWLSKKAAEIVANAEVLPSSICPISKIPCEDLWIGQVLGPSIEKGIITAHHDSRYAAGFRDDHRTEITSHFCSEGANRKFETFWMFEHHRVNK